MMNSMTAFGRHRADLGGKTLTVEIKSVNSRYFDLSVRMPRAMSYLEEKIKPYLQSRGVTRGKVEVSIWQEASATGGEPVNIVLNETVAAGYIAALCQLRDRFGLTDDITTMNVAKNVDVVVTIVIVVTTAAVAVMIVIVVTIATVQTNVTADANKNRTQKSLNIQA